MMLVTSPIPSIIVAMIKPNFPEIIKYIIPAIIPVKKDNEMTIENQAIISANNSNKVMYLLGFSGGSLDFFFLNCTPI